MTERSAPQPAVTEQAVTRPAPQPVVTEPAVTERPAPQPVVTQPAVTEQAAPQPAMTERPAPKPIVTERPTPQPIVTERPTPQPIVAERPAPQPIVTERPAPQPIVTERPAPQPIVTAETASAPQPAPVEMQPRAETGATAPPVQQQPWTATMRKEFDAAQVLGRAGLNARSPAAAAVAVPSAGSAAPAGASVSQGALAASFKEVTVPSADESVYAKSASSPTADARTARAAVSDSAVPVVDPEIVGRSSEVVASAPVRMSGTPTARRADAAGDGMAEPTLSSEPIAASSPGASKPAPVGATVYGGAPAPAADTAASVGSRIQDLDRALDAGGRVAAGSGSDDGSGSQGGGAAAGPAGRDPRLPAGWNVSGSLGLRPLLNVIHPALPDRYPDEIVQMTVRVLIRVDPAGWVRVERFEQDSGSTALNNEITKTLRQWRYEPVDDRDPVYGTVTIQIRSRSN